MSTARLSFLVRNRRAWRGLLVGVLALTALGCSYGISVRRAANPTLANALRSSLVESDDLSPRTRETLHRLDLDSHYQHDPQDAYALLQGAAAADPQPELLFALAEMSYLFGRKAEKAQTDDACAFYYLCAGYAYHYLFDPPPAQATCGGLNPYDPRFRLACEMYNIGLAKCIRAAQRTGRLDPRQQMLLPTPDGQAFNLSVVQHGFPWQPEEFGTLLFCEDYEVVGLPNQYHGYGLGAALIGTRVGDAKSGPGPATALKYPREVAFPITAFFRFEGSVADLGARRTGRLELYNPLAIQTVDVGGRSLPLETDLTTPLAYFLSHSDLEGIESTGLLHADKVQDRAGIYMFEPYQPGKIPVVMVHGLWSSPLTWAVLFNDLRADPLLRERFQFWFYLYPTGNPYIATAADLRDSLVRLRAEVDPQHRDGALDQMVFVGHSMGGLVSRLMTEDSGDAFWHLLSDQPFDTVKARPETLAELRRLCFFERQPGVRRVVFIATPHHGSKLAPSPPAQLVSQFIQLPKALVTAAGDVAREDPQLAPGLREGPFANNLDLLAPRAPALELLASRPRPPGVTFHSIVGDVYGKGQDGSDGVVPYTSAHLDGVASELIVPAGHSTVHQHPRTALEVKRILLQHLQELSGPQPVTLAPPVVRQMTPPGPIAQP